MTGPSSRGVAVAPGAGAGSAPAEVRIQLSATERLVEVAQELSLARNLAGIMAVVRHAARELTGAEGATFVLREDEHCFYADEDAISPLWKGRRFPLNGCISGWTMLHRKAAVIEDVYADPRIPHDIYRRTFVQSLAMVPVRTAAPVAAIGNYWATRHVASEGEVKLLCALADLTSVAMQNVQLYGELQKRIAEVQGAVRARDEFIMVAAHELRTPLTALQLQLQMLEMAAQNDGVEGRMARSASRAVAAARRLGALVDGLLDASRLTHGSLTLNLTDFDLVAAAREVVGQFEASARRAGCRLEVDVPPALVGCWDRLRIQQVLMHLLSNALKYGSGKPVKIAVQRREPRVVLEVVDQGAGVPPEAAGLIFERFGRAGKVTHYAGLGLGLYLSRQVVEAHGGTIGFHSAPGEGCTFRVDLPLLQRGRPSQAAPSS